jgi:HAD superfamily hydrolase (TIGR01450 family)
MPASTIPRATLPLLIERYACLLLDAYGVLVTHDGPLPGAETAIRHLNALGHPYFILTNDASRSPQTSSRRYTGMGLPIPAERIISSGLALTPYFEAQGLRGSRCLVLGTEDSKHYVRDAGGVPVSLGDGVDADLVVVCDECGYSFLEMLDETLSFLYRKLDAGETPRLILANPDLLYPAADRRYGFTGGAVALLLEEALRLRYPRREDLAFVRLGKPFTPMFEEAFRRSGTRDMVMVGDQPRTDIRGARAFGIDSALITTGVTRIEHGAFDDDRPTWILESLSIDTTERSAAS